MVINAFIHEDIHHFTGILLKAQLDQQSASGVIPFLLRNRNRLCLSDQHLVVALLASQVGHGHNGHRLNRSANISTDLTGRRYLHLRNILGDSSGRTSAMRNCNHIRHGVEAARLTQDGRRIAMALIHGLTQHHMGNITLSFNHFAFICHPRSSQVGETIKLRIALSSDTLQLIQLHDFMQCHVDLRSIQHILCRSHCLSSAGSQHIQCLLRICVADLCDTVCNLIHLQMEDGGSELVRKLPLFHAHVLRTGHTPSLTGAQQGKIHTAQRIDQVPGLSQRLQLVQKLFVIGMSVHRDIGDILHLQGSPHVLYAAQSKGFGVRNRPQCGRHLHLIDQDVGQRIHDPSNVNHSQSIDACTI